ncbi:MAG: UDP-N-acetylglucosamine 1-carboxyvinyltransferase [Halioglobus sp.]|nr:UDP-N-acetylglucosamine 1-carboxyvinyltransferase [Halioglobus sp.]
MDKLLIQGGKPLRGGVRIAGSKNAALPILAATLLAEQPVTIANLPHLQDVTTMVELLGCIGVDLTVGEKLTVEADANAIVHCSAPYELVKNMRAAVLVLGPLLARFGRARVWFAGGALSGARPVNLHLRGLEAMGARIHQSGGYIEARVEGRLRGARIVMDQVTVGGTENIMMAATLAQGQTVIENAAREPEIVDLAQCLIAMGARIRGHGSATLVIDGVTSLGGCTYEVMPDRIETGTYLAAAAATRGKVLLRNTCPANMAAVLRKLEEAGACLEAGDDWIALDMAARRPRAVSLTTEPYPGFPTDLQAQFMAMNALAQGTATVTETVIADRLGQAHELQRMGADIVVSGNVATIVGQDSLRGTAVMASDLRASAGLVIAGLAAHGKTRISGIHHIDRGYERIEEKLQILGADIRRVGSRSS